MRSSPDRKARVRQRLRKKISINLKEELAGLVADSSIRVGFFNQGLGTGAASASDFIISGGAAITVP